MLQACGLTLMQADRLPDHAAFDGYAHGTDASVPLLCTEKDAVKLWRLRPDALAVPLELSIDPAFYDSFDAWFAALG